MEETATLSVGSDRAVALHKVWFDTPPPVRDNQLSDSDRVVPLMRIASFRDPVGTPTLSATTQASGDVSEYSDEEERSTGRPPGSGWQADDEATAARLIALRRMGAQSSQYSWMSPEFSLYGVPIGSATSQVSVPFTPQPLSASPDGLGTVGFEDMFSLSQDSSQEWSTVKVTTTGAEAPQGASVVFQAQSQTMDVVITAVAERRVCGRRDATFGPACQAQRPSDGGSGRGWQCPRCLYYHSPDYEDTERNGQLSMYGSAPPPVTGGAFDDPGSRLETAPISMSRMLARANRGGRRTQYEQIDSFLEGKQDPTLWRIAKQMSLPSPTVRRAGDLWCSYRALQLMLHDQGHVRAVLLYMALLDTSVPFPMHEFIEAFHRSSIGLYGEEYFYKNITKKGQSMLKEFATKYNTAVDASDLDAADQPTKQGVDLINALSQEDRESMCSEMFVATWHSVMEKMVKSGMMITLRADEMAWKYLDLVVQRHVDPADQARALKAARVWMEDFAQMGYFTGNNESQYNKVRNAKKAVARGRSVSEVTANKYRIQSPKFWLRDSSMPVGITMYNLYWISRSDESTVEEFKMDIDAVCRDLTLSLHAIYNTMLWYFQQRPHMMSLRPGKLPPKPSSGSPKRRRRGRAAATPGATASANVEEEAPLDYEAVSHKDDEEENEGSQHPSKRMHQRVAEPAPGL
jgi:hypothetical protein